MLIDVKSECRYVHNQCDVYTELVTTCIQTLIGINYTHMEYIHRRDAINPAMLIKQIKHVWQKKSWKCWAIHDFS